MKEKPSDSLLNKAFSKRLQTRNLNLAKIIKAKRIYVYGTLSTGEKLNEVFFLEGIKIFPEQIKFFIQGGSMEEISLISESYSFLRRSDRHTICLDARVEPFIFEIL